MTNYIPACEMYDFSDLNEALSTEYARESAMILGFDYEMPAYEGVGEKVKGAVTAAVDKLKEIGRTIKNKVKDMLDAAGEKITKACEAHPLLGKVVDAMKSVFNWISQPFSAAWSALKNAKQAITAKIHDKTAPKAEVEETPGAESFFDFDFDLEVATEAEEAGEKKSIREHVMTVLRKAADTVDEAHAKVDLFTEKQAVKVATKLATHIAKKEAVKGYKEANPNATKADIKNFKATNNPVIDIVGGAAGKTVNMIQDAAATGIKVARQLDSTILGTFVGILSRVIGLVAKVVALPVRVLHMTYKIAKEGKGAADATTSAVAAAADNVVAGESFFGYEW